MACILIRPGVVKLGNKLNRDLMSVLLKRNVAKSMPVKASALVVFGSPSDAGECSLQNGKALTPVDC